jgi:hypothetical protein
MQHAKLTHDAEWILREIIDDYARQLSPSERAAFFKELSKKTAERSRVKDEASREDSTFIN